MGMAASQVRFLSLQSRKNTIGLNLMTLSNRRTALSRDMKRVAANYNNAMNQKILKWTNDSGVTYNDINYDLLMKPNAMNSTLPYIVTDAQGRVVLDDNKIILDGEETDVSYRDLATMISKYSGFKDYASTYNNTSGLVGNGTIELINEGQPDQTIGAINSSGVEGGLANEENPYQIVSTSTNMQAGSLQFDIMQKLGLLTEAEVIEVQDTLLDVYGNDHDAGGPYPVTCLMGQYYLCCAHIEAFEALRDEVKTCLIAGFNTPTETTTIDKDDTTHLTNIKNTVKSDGTVVTFKLNNEKSSFLNLIDFSENANSTHTDIYNNFVAEGLNTNIANLKYTATADGEVRYEFKTDNLINLLSSTKINKAAESYFQAPRDEDGRKDENNLVAGYGETLNWNSNYTWGGLYNDVEYNYAHNNDENQRYSQLLLTASYEYEGPDWDGQIDAYNELCEFINDFAGGLSGALSSNGLVCDEEALNAAKEATKMIFHGDLGKRDILNYPTTNRDLYRGKHSDWWYSEKASERSFENNTMGEMVHLQRNHLDRTLITVSPYNVFRTLLTFYNAYSGGSCPSNDNMKLSILEAQSIEVTEYDNTNNTEPPAHSFDWTPQPNYTYNMTNAAGYEAYWVGYEELKLENNTSIYECTICRQNTGTNNSNTIQFGHNGKDYIAVEFDYYTFYAKNSDGSGKCDEEGNGVNPNETGYWDKCLSKKEYITYEAKPNYQGNLIPDISKDIVKIDTFDVNCSDDGYTNYTDMATRVMQLTNDDGTHYYVYSSKEFTNNTSLSNTLINNTIENLNDTMPNGYEETFPDGTPLDNDNAKEIAMNFNYYGLDDEETAKITNYSPEAKPYTAYEFLATGAYIPVQKERNKSEYAIDYVNVNIADSSIQNLEDRKKNLLEQINNKQASLNTLFASKQSKIMDYFNALFKMISERGWVYDANVNNKTNPSASQQYLNAKLQNNLFFITEVESVNGKDFDYATKVVNNVSRVIEIYDEDASNVALSQYEAEKADITAKEKVIDMRISKLEAEEEAISTEMDSLKTIINDNVQNTFKIFS